MCDLDMRVQPIFMSAFEVTFPKIMAFNQLMVVVYIPFFY